MDLLQGQAMNSNKYFLIRDLVQKTAVSADSIRFYEKKQLIQPRFRAENNYRYYDDQALKRLIFIKRCRSLDLSLKEIETLIQLEQQPKQNCQAVNQLIDHHLIQVEHKMAELAQLQTQLQQLRQACSVQTTIADCQILKQLESTD